MSAAFILKEVKCISGYSMHGVQVSEFLLLKTKQGKPPVVWVVEAKSSSPRPDNKVPFDKFIQEIKSKMINAFSLTLASCLKRHEKAKGKLPEHFQNLDLAITNFGILHITSKVLYTLLGKIPVK